MNINDIADLAGKTVKRGLDQFDPDNDIEEHGIEFTDGTVIFFAATPFTTGSVTTYIYENMEEAKKDFL